jgi:very-short-patch-repair endonuclease
MEQMHTGDGAIAALAARQHGLVTTAQLAAAGLGRRAIAHRVASGRLVRRHRGVYQVGPTAAPLSPQMAAVLACGATAALSHQSAAAIWGFGQREGLVRVTVEGDSARSRRGIRVHHTLSLRAAVIHGLPVTDPARTLRDLRTVLTGAQHDRAGEQAHILGLVIADGAPEPDFTRSDGERRLKALCKAAHLPLPRMNAIVAGWEVDAHWPAHRLIVEIDGWNFHSSRRAFERDRHKDAQLTATGQRVIRITHRRLTHQPHTVTAQLAALLAATPA